MANGEQPANAALAAAMQVNDIGFAEFTANLVLKVFDGLVAANMSQTEAYLQLLQGVAKTLSAYVNDTKDDIDGTQILQFLAAALPASGNGEPKLLKVGTPLSADEATDLNNALQLATADGGASTDNKVAQAAQSLTEKQLDDLFDAAARRLTANKYDLLKEMVKQGLLRLVITRGIIETRMTFQTSVSSTLTENQSSFERKAFSAKAKVATGGALSRWVKASGSTSYTDVKVRTTNEAQQDTSGTSVNIFGLVHIEFKTDYLPLAPTTA